MTGPNPLTLAGLREKRGELESEVQALGDQLLADDVTDEVAETIQGNIDRIMGEGGELSKLDDRIKSLEKVQALKEAKMAELQKQNGEIDDIRKEARRGRDKFALPATCRRHRLKNFLKEDIDGKTPEHRAYQLGQWFLYRASCDMPHRYNGSAAQKAKDYCIEHGLTKGELGQGILNALPIDKTEAGIGNVESFSADMIALFEQYGVARSVFKNRPVPQGGTVNFPRNATRVDAFFIDEGQVITSSEATYTNETLSPKKIAGITVYTRELGQDNIIQLADDLAMQLAWATAKREDYASFNGTGAADAANGSITGLRVALQGTNTQVGAVGTAADWGGFTMDDFHAVMALLPEYAYTPTLTWVTSRQFHASVMQRLEVAAGGNTITDIEQGAMRPMFLGVPVVFSQQFPSTASASDVVCTLGSHDLGCSYATRMEVEITFSEQATVDSLNLWQQGLVGVRSMERFDSKCHDVPAGGPVAGLETAAT